MGRIIADSVRGLPHIGTIDDMIADRIANLDYSSVLMFMIDTAPSNALPYLAEFFNILGFKGWQFADTDTKQRDLLKKAILLHQHSGTPYSIKESLKMIGVPIVRIDEGIALHYDGKGYYNGIYNYSSGSSFDFRVIVDYTNFTPVTQQWLDDIKKLVLAWKNTRSRLVDISVGADFTDTLSGADTLELNVQYPSNPSSNYTFII